MTPQTRELIRERILLFLHDAPRIGLIAETLRAGLTNSGYVLDEAHVARELEYLRDKGLIGSRASELSAGSLRYALTSKGTEYLEAQGLV